MAYFLLITLYFFLGWESGYADAAVREDLRARYETIFARQAVFDEERVIQLEEDTRNYFYERELNSGRISTDDVATRHLHGMDESDADLYHLHSKLLLYLNFYQINIKGKRLNDWSPYHLLLDAIRDVDYRHVSFSGQDSRHYYDVLRDTAHKHLWQVVRTYQEHFPFLEWDFCDRFEESCLTEERKISWKTAEEVAIALNMAVDTLNTKVNAINKMTKFTFLMRVKRKYREEVQDYLRTYEDLMDTPYGTLLFLISVKQHSKMLTAPNIFSAHRLPELSYVDTDTVLGLFEQIEKMFTTRMEKLASLYNMSVKQELVDFLFRYHSLALAEYLVSNPNFFSTINFYLKRSEVGHAANEKPDRHSKKLALAGILGMSYAAIHHLGRFEKGKVFYFVSLLIGGSAVVFSAVQQKSLKTVFSLHNQVAEMRGSIVMRQSNNLRYFLHKLGSFARIRGDAIFQGGMLALYSILFLHHIHGAINVAKNSSYIKVFSESREEIALRLSSLDPDVVYQGFNLQEIGKTLGNYPNLSKIHSLSFPEKMEIASKLFGDYGPLKKWKTDNKGVIELGDMTDEQIQNLRSIGESLRQKFKPQEDKTVKDFADLIGDSPELATRELEKIERLIKKLFDVEPHKGDNQVL